ncbi:MAG: transketolase [Spirochaetes bacterium]|nr:transketolase [Spirochaetota bacterium]
MSLSVQEFEQLEAQACELRKLTVDTVLWANGGHIGGSLSASDILTIVYRRYMRYDSARPDWPERDRFVLSKGHIGVGFAPLLATLGFFDAELLKTYNHTHSSLGMHLDRNKVPGLDASTGSLGHGLGMALGMALSARLQKQDSKIFCLLGDGECDEGSVWEAAMAIAHYKAGNVIPIVDRNRCMIDGPTEQVMRLEPFADKWRAFGFVVQEVDGHDFYQLAAALDMALADSSQPVVIIANTFKGAGIALMQDNYKYHYASVDQAMAGQCKADIDAYHAARLQKKERNNG